MIQISPNDPCPCESGRKTGKCCGRTGILAPKSKSTKPPHQPTGLRNNKCYAAATADCTSKISREHFISDGIQKLLGTEQEIHANGLAWSGLAWLPEGETKHLSSKAFQSNILCTRHNSALSPLDYVALRFFEKLSTIPDTLQKRECPREQVFLFSGVDIEKWMIKTLCGFVFSGNSATKEGARIANWSVPSLWLEFLFGDAELPVPMGLYFISKVGSTLSTSHAFGIAPIKDPAIGITGLLLRLRGLEFVLALARPEPAPNSLLAGAPYRPSELAFVHSNRTVILRLGWAPQIAPRAVVIDYLPSRGGT